MGVILDTSILVAAERRRVDLAAFLRNVSTGAAVSAITASELLHGLERARMTGVRTRRARFVDALLAHVPVLPFTLDSARVHAQLWADLASRGAVIGYHDLLIAATAREHGAAVATLNRREFERVPGLPLADVDAYFDPSG